MDCDGVEVYLLGRHLVFIPGGVGTRDRKDTVADVTDVPERRRTCVTSSSLYNVQELLGTCPWRCRVEVPSRRLLSVMMVRRVLGVSPVGPCARRRPGWWQPHVEWVADDCP